MTLVASRLMPAAIVAHAALVLYSSSRPARLDACDDLFNCATKCVESDCWCEWGSLGWTGFKDDATTADDSGCASRNADGDEGCESDMVAYDRYDNCDPECPIDDWTPCANDPEGDPYVHALPRSFYTKCCAEG